MLTNAHSANWATAAMLRYIYFCNFRDKLYFTSVVFMRHTFCSYLNILKKKCDFELSYILSSTSIRIYSCLHDVFALCFFLERLVPLVLFFPIQCNHSRHLTPFHLTNQTEPGSHTHSVSAAPTQRSKVFRVAHLREAGQKQWREQWHATDSQSEKGRTAGHIFYMCT